MATVIGDPEPVELAQLRERRERLGLDRKDEVWDGVLHMNPAPYSRHAAVLSQLAVLFDAPARARQLVLLMADFNLGTPENYRVPDGGLLRGRPGPLYLPTAALAVEVLSPGDETWEKLPFYAARGVEELLIVDPEEHIVQWLALRDGTYQAVDHSAIIELGAAELAQRIDWP